MDKLTEDHIASVIREEHYTKVGLKTTVCVLILKNGFEVTATSACVNSDNYDQETGNKYARARAVDKVWELEGYLLQQHSQEDLFEVDDL